MNSRASNVDWHSGTGRPRRRTTRARVVDAACARSDLFERRRQLMDDWSAYVAGSAGNAG